jgi:hypothetical protein
MNPLLFPTLLLTAVLFLIGEQISRRTSSLWPVALPHPLCSLKG